MYVLYLNKKTGDYFVKYFSNVWWFTRLDFCECLKKIGTWGRSDFAQIWCDFHNKKIDNQTLRQKLDSIKV